MTSVPPDQPAGTPAGPSAPSPAALAEPGPAAAAPGPDMAAASGPAAADSSPAPADSGPARQAEAGPAAVAEAGPAAAAVAGAGGAVAERGPGATRSGWRRGRLVAAGLGTAVLLAGGGTAAWAYAGDVPRGTTVLGIDLGGLSRADAERRLAERLGDRTAAAFPVVVDGRPVTLLPAQVGLALDGPATVAAAARGRPAPWGSRTVAPVVTVDAARLDAVLRRAVGKVGRPMTLPAIRYAGLTPTPRYPQPGRDLDPQASAAAVRAGWPGTAPVTVPLVERRPVTSREQVDTLVAELARPAVAAPVTVATDAGAFTLSPAMIAKSLVLTADRSGAITPRVDPKKLRSAAAKALAAVEVKPQEARIALAGGAPKVVASTAGKAVDTGKLTADLLAVLPATGARRLTATLVATAAGTTDEQLRRLGVKERVATFTTQFTGGLSSPRSRNIVQAAKEVDGALVKPGETFSLNGHTGPRSYPQGYVDAPVILDGKLVPGVGGGVSQFATTLFNAAYYAGLQDVEHKPHSFWFSRYPSVIESTIFYPTLDLRFKNDTPYGVLIDTSYTRKSVTVSMWSTKVYDSVTTVRSARRDTVAPRTVHLAPGPSCIATDGIPGFAQDAWRVFRKGGREIRREKFSWRYQPEPRYICDADPS